MPRYLRDLTPPELRAAIERDAPLLVPAGCVECHGNHLPVGTDTLVAEAVVAAVAERLGGIVAPTIDYGPTGYAVSGPERGTIDVAAEPFYGYVKAVLAGLVRLGFRSIFVVVHHQGPEGPEAMAFRFAAAALFNEIQHERGHGWWGERRPEPVARIALVPTIPPAIAAKVRGDHAGRTETALMLHLAPDRVRLDALEAGDFWYTHESGRESAAATATHGAELLATMIDAVAAVVGG